MKPALRTAFGSAIKSQIQSAKTLSSKRNASFRTFAQATTSINANYVASFSNPLSIMKAQPLQGGFSAGVGLQNSRDSFVDPARSTQKNSFSG